VTLHDIRQHPDRFIVDTDAGLTLMITSKRMMPVSLLVTTLPMLGDYFTNDLLSASPDTSMVGNLINNTVLTPGQTGQAGAFVMLVLLVSIIPMLIYVRANRTGVEVQS